MSKNPVNVELFLRKSDITIVCPNPQCQATMIKREVPFTSLSNFPLPHGSNLPWVNLRNNDDIATEKCKYCGTVIKVTAEIKAEIVEENKTEASTEIASEFAVTTDEKDIEPEQTKISSFVK